MQNISRLEDCLNYLIEDLTYYKSLNGYLKQIQELENIIKTLKEGITTDWEELKQVSDLIRKAEIYLEKAKRLQKEFEDEQIKDVENEFEISERTRTVMKKAKKRIESANENVDYGLEK